MVKSEGKIIIALLSSCIDRNCKTNNGHIIYIFEILFNDNNNGIIVFIFLVS